MTKDAEATCAHLLANAKVVEGQLKALRTEHEILRAEATALQRCLDKSGVLPSAELEAELQRNGLVESMGVPPSKTPETPVAPPTPGSGATTPTHSTRSLTRQGRSPRPRDFGVRGRSPPPAESPQVSDLPSVPLEVEEVKCPAPSAHEFQNVFQAVLEEGSPSAEHQALRSLQSLLRHDPGAFHEYVDNKSPGASALSAAVRGNKLDAVKILLKVRADPNERDEKGVTALHLAAFDGHLDVCKVLTLARADVDACDRHGQTPLFFAPNKEVCKLLIERKSDVNVLNRRGQSALHMAGRAGLHEVLAWLSSRVSQTLCELKDVHGINAKTYAKMSGVPAPIPAPIPVRSTRTPSPTHSIQSSQNKGRLGRSPRSGSLKSLGSARNDGRNSPAATSAKSLPSVPTAHAFDFFEVANSPSHSPPKGAPAASPEAQQLPSMSTLVGDYTEPSLESMYAGLDSLERLQKMRGRSQTIDRGDRGDTVAALAAAAAVATAAVTTAAELTPRTTAGPAAQVKASPVAEPEREPEKVTLGTDEMADLGIMEADPDEAEEDLSHLGIVDDGEIDDLAAGVMEADPLAPLDGELDECW